MNKAVHPDTGNLNECSALLKSSYGKLWEEGRCKEIDRLAQGYKPTVPEGTNTIFIIKFDQILVAAKRKATYLRLVVADRLTKENSSWVRFTVIGNNIDYPRDIRTKMGDLTTAKIPLISLSGRRARFMMLNIKDFYLNTAMSGFEYMQIPNSQILENNETPQLAADQTQRHHVCRDQKRTDAWAHCVGQTDK